MRVFLSYRRDDAAPWAGRLSDALAAQFGEGSVFLDVTGVRPGSSFGDEIHAALDRCDATLAVIGPRWLSVVGGEGEPRLANPDDYVRRELAMALDRSTPTIPVLVGGAALPDIAQLPEELQPLVLRQAIEVRDESWHDDVERLVRSLRGKPRRSAASGPPRWLATTAIALVVAALVVGGLVLLRDGDGDGDDGSTTESTLADAVPFDPVNATPPLCESPHNEGWTDLGFRGSTDPGTSPWSFETIGAYSRELDGGWMVIVETTATNQHPDASMTHYPFYTLIANGSSWTPECYRISAAASMVGPGESSTSLTGFRLPSEPVGAMTVAVNSSGDHYSIDLAPSG